MAFADTDRIAPYLRSTIFSALAASRRAARATAPQTAFADTDRIVPYLRRPLRAMVAEMRPFTAFVVIGLVVLIVVAFAVKLATTGLAP